MKLAVKVRKAFEGPMRSYLIVGVSVYLFEVTVIIATQALGASTVLAVSLGFWLGLIASFILQKFVTFGDKRTRPHILLPQVIAFGLLVLFNFGFTVLTAELLASVMPAVLIRTGSLAITTVWNYYLYKTRIFKPGDEPVVY